MSVKIYTVIMPDDRKYFTVGKSIKEVANRHGVSIKNVSIGADLLHLPPIRNYYHLIKMKGE